MSIIENAETNVAEDVILIGGAVVIVGGIAYLIITNLPNILSTLSNMVSQAIESKSLQTGADQSSNSNNYQNANVVYTNSTSQYQTALNNLNNAFANSSPNAQIVVSPNNQVESTYGGQPATLVQTQMGSISKPYLYSNGYQGAGYYYDKNSNGSITIQDIANLYDYNNSYLYRSSYIQ